MFTSRAEFRLALRPDNADQRLTEKGYKIGCVSNDRYIKMKAVKDQLIQATEILKSITKPASYWNDLLSLESTKNSQQKR